MSWECTLYFDIDLSNLIIYDIWKKFIFVGSLLDRHWWNYGVGSKSYIPSICWEFNIVVRLDCHDSDHVSVVILWLGMLQKMPTFGTGHYFSPFILQDSVFVPWLLCSHASLPSSACCKCNLSLARRPRWYGILYVQNYSTHNIYDK